MLVGHMRARLRTRALIANISSSFVFRLGDNDKRTSMPAQRIYTGQFMRSRTSKRSLYGIRPLTVQAAIISTSIGHFAFQYCRSNTSNLFQHQFRSQKGQLEALEKSPFFTSVRTYNSGLRIGRANQISRPRRSSETPSVAARMHR